MIPRVLSGILSLATATTVWATETPDSLHIQNLNEIIVTGSNSAVGRNTLPYTVTVISGNQLEASGDTRLLSAVSGLVPSLFVTQRNILGFGVSNGGAGHIKLRGVGGDRASGVLMMVDGQPQFAGLYSHHVADFYQSEYIDHVEILRGPASVLYGSNAMAGVINVITKSSPAHGVKTTLTSKAGSYATWITSLTNTIKIGRFSSLVSAGYDRTDGVRKNFDFNQTNVYAKAGYDVNDQWNVKADYALMASHGNDPVYPSLKGQDEIYAQRIIRGETSLTALNTYSTINGALRVYYSYGNHFIHDPAYFHSLDDRLGVIAYQNFKPWQSADATVGFDFDRYTGKIPMSGGKDMTENPMATMERKAIDEYSPYITIQQGLWNDNIIINGGLRVANSNLFATRWIPQFGFVLPNLHGWSLKASIADGYRNPSFRELYLYKFANPALKPESMVNYEISLGKRISHYLNADLTAYYAHGSNLIEQTATGNSNTGSFINKGLEITIQSTPTEQLLLHATYSYLHTSLGAITGAPRHQYYIGAGYNVCNNLHADIAFKGVAGLFVAYDVKHQNYATLNLRLTYRLIRQLQLFVNFDNITDARYMINKGYPMPGFTAMGGFKLEI